MRHCLRVSGAFFVTRFPMRPGEIARRAAVGPSIGTQGAAGRPAEALFAEVLLGAAAPLILTQGPPDVYQLANSGLQLRCPK